ncbi:YxiG family protein [Tumebacillus permanentifrigoris]|uniref:Uncharacterized protein n=1 Tax=Tumebacillus permanentifrigoris TaxID=378543 RepID=A0A316DCU3_9BACL|nr:hypothetical protein [Tumebacillus permanentifrigoris]PWK15997.1 hypothetical protein C7459_102243 [Tumebacillus permanentifrigoris]
MSKKELEIMLASVRASIITSFSVDLLNNCVMFTVHTYHSEVDYVENTIVFGGVASYFFSAGKDNARRDLYPPDIDDIREMSSIYFYENGIGSIGFVDITDEWAKRWVRYYGSNVNFLVEMTDSVLFIEANRIRINDTELIVEYPSE